MNMIPSHLRLILTVYALLVISLHGQEVYVPKTKLEALELQIGTVIFKGSTMVGTVATRNGLLSVTCKESTDASNGHKEYGLAIGVSKEGERTEEVTLVDYEELDSLLDAIERLVKVDYTVTSFTGFEAVYVTRGELRMVTYKNSTGTGIRAVLQSGGVNRTKIYLSMEQLSQLRVAVTEAKAKLDEVIRANLASKQDTP